MIGVPFNPDNCAFIANQALNANQFRAVPNSANTTTHTVLWDFVAEKLYWVDTKTNLIEHELPSANACNFVADINFVSLGDIINYNCTPQNGVAPYTYQWSLEAAPQQDFVIVGSSVGPILGIAPLESKPINIGLLKCVVTDAEGCKTTASFMPYVLVIV